jgi:hypothetical protein
LLYKQQSADWPARLQERLMQEDKRVLDWFSEASLRFRRSHIPSRPAEFTTLELVSDASGMHYSVCFNDQAAAYRTAIFEDISKVVGRENLFKRALVLVKAWCLYELPRYLKLPLNGE